MMPAALRDLLVTVTDTYAVVAEHGRPDDMRPSVWEIEGLNGKRWFAKQHVGPRLHQREVDAYQQWTKALGSDRAPFLAAADSKERTVVVTAVPGSSLDKLRLPAEQEREAYRQAGLLLNRLHTADPGQPPSAATETDWDDKLAKLLDGAARYVTADEIAMLRSLAKQAPADLPKVVAHGDYMPKNWMWNESEQRLRIIDFERTQHEPAARHDLSRLHYRVLHHRLDLAAAFYRGYGRPLSRDEEQALTTYAAVDALDSVCWGATHHDIDLVDEAHTMIANLRAECTLRSVGW
ncbi:phosphotransferase enzyme family protein [Streptomyces sp. PSKA30]|uniref:phosphotransferase enzyme family protein n=1 Tax=Streptomyces sp. PSKA30 TaxID=2874597 RepID=UPI001CD0F145|nr:aminoglycoside phosphotransferase family protein [Streptomyces sp. PSKA30]MBZ9641407.1 aminoglycoside phosphotransferase family protein [Streptomyces sp. PSKA30]